MDATDFSFPAAMKDPSIFPAIKPSQMMHVALFTSDLEASKTFWLAITGGRIAWEIPSKIAFVAFDKEHHRISLIAKPPIIDESGTRIPLERGTLHHVSFTFPCLKDLLLAYRQRLAQHGLKPVRCTHHGPAMGMYYHDPDGNEVQLLFEIYRDIEAYDRYVASDEFLKLPKPIGPSFDPEKLIERLLAGESEDKVVDVSLLL